jgi:hypothetical protein
MLQLAEGEDLVSSLVITPDKRYFVRISGRRFVDDIVAEIEIPGYDNPEILYEVFIGVEVYLGNKSIKHRPPFII